MNIKKLTYRTTLGTILLLPMLVACTGNEVPMRDVEPMPGKQEMLIRWTVQSEGMADGRALIDKDEALRSACTPLPSGDGKAIGIWSAYELEGVITKNVLEEDGDVSLIYKVGTTWDNWNGWTYGEDAAIWKNGAEYYFNGYFPKDGGLIAKGDNTFQGYYNIETTQTDVMVARTVVNTAADTFKGSPVNLHMKHTLATLQFKFQMEEGTATKNVLKSFSLDNNLITAATLNARIEQKDYTEKVTLSMTNPTTSQNHTRTYVWEDMNGLPFYNTEDEIVIAIPYTTGTDLYSQNDGHILVIPQTCDTPPTFDCVIGTQRFEEQSLKTNVFEPGNRYIYTIIMKGNVLNVTLSVKPWNVLNSSYDINF